MYLIEGNSALSDFRLKKYWKNISHEINTKPQIEARFFYCVWLEDDYFASPEQFTDLKELLGTQNSKKYDKKPIFFVTPRIGTTSPWSTKAEEICNHSGIRNILRLERVVAWYAHSLDQFEVETLIPLVHDRMTESVLLDSTHLRKLHSPEKSRGVVEIDVLKNGAEELEKANSRLGLAMSQKEIEYLTGRFQDLGRNPTDVEIMMFAQANSEHCRHKIFNADWIIDGEEKQLTLFEMIKNTHALNQNSVISAYSDNGAIVEGHSGSIITSKTTNREYEYIKTNFGIIMKVETHNHPTGISPFEGAATGAGGEIRDEGATGRGGKPKAGITGFTVSHLRLPDFEAPWETTRRLNPNIKSALEIMLEAPIGSASYNNEFGRPALSGYFRSFEEVPHKHLVRGYDKPIMLAGGMGSIRKENFLKSRATGGSHIIILGGPSMLIGLGGGATSSQSSGTVEHDLDFASVQRDNAEMQRRCQEVIDRCANSILDGVHANPIESIHDVGAGGLSNAIPEILSDSDKGGVVELRAIPNSEPSLSPMEIWCNEAQERYVLIVKEKNLLRFTEICTREKCPFAVVGTVSDTEQLRVFDSEHQRNVIDIPMDVLFGNLPNMTREVSRIKPYATTIDTSNIPFEKSLLSILRYPGVGDKRFLITIGDRTVGGLCVRDQMVGPWQVPVADCAVTATGFDSCTGEAMSIGERSPVALIDAVASARLAVGEAITNIAASRIMDLKDIVLSANWMCAAGYPAEDVNLFEMVKAVGMDLCPALGINIPVGKDSMSMRTGWMEGSERFETVSPTSLIVSAFAPVLDIEASLTPELQMEEDSILIFFDLAEGRQRLGGSVFATTHKVKGCVPADIESAEIIKQFFEAIQLLNDAGYLLAYHDKSDGGLAVTLIEMAIASRCGVEIEISNLGGNINSALFNEELGAVVQIRKSDESNVINYLSQYEMLSPNIHVIGYPTLRKKLVVNSNGIKLADLDMFKLLKAFSETTYHLQSLRDNPKTAKEELDTILNPKDPGLSILVPHAATLEPVSSNVAPKIKKAPKLAVLREQGVNGHIEMAAAFTRAGFNTVDVHMSDIVEGRDDLRDYTGLAVCGGFSYGDVLGAGRGWAGTITFNTKVYDVFARFFSDQNTFTFGVCNGCQVLSELRALIPGAEMWPRFEKNKSEQFEARLSLVEVLPSASIVLEGLDGMRAPIAVSHSEGQMKPSDQTKAGEQTCLRFIDNFGNPTEIYPANPNGSHQGITGVTSTDGRVTIMMPHPERVFLTQQLSWMEKSWRQKESPWMGLFYNARRWTNSS